MGKKARGPGRPRIVDATLSIEEDGLDNNDNDEAGLLTDEDTENIPPMEASEESRGSYYPTKSMVTLTIKSANTPREPLQEVTGNVGEVEVTNESKSKKQKRRKPKDNKTAGNTTRGTMKANKDDRKFELVVKVDEVLPSSTDMLQETAVDLVHSPLGNEKPLLAANEARIDYSPAVNAAVARLKSAMSHETLNAESMRGPKGAGNTASQFPECHELRLGGSRPQESNSLTGEHLTLATHEDASSAVRNGNAFTQSAEVKQPPSPEREVEDDDPTPRTGTQTPNRSTVNDSGAVHKLTSLFECPVESGPGTPKFQLTGLADKPQQAQKMADAEQEPASAMEALGEAIEKVHAALSPENQTGHAPTIATKDKEARSAPKTKASSPMKQHVTATSRPRTGASLSPTKPGARTTGAPRAIVTSPNKTMPANSANPTKSTVASLRAPPPLAKSAKPSTVSTFQLPSEAITAKLKAQKEERLRRQEEEAAKAKEAANRRRSLKLSTSAKPTFEVRQTNTSRVRTGKADPTTSPGKSATVPPRKRTSSISGGANSSTIFRPQARQPGSDGPPTKRARPSSVFTPSRPVAAQNASPIRGRPVSATPSGANGTRNNPSTSKGREVFRRERLAREAERERAEAARRARAEAAERGRQLSRQWAEKAKKTKTGKNTSAASEAQELPALEQLSLNEHKNAAATAGGPEQIVA